MADREFPLKLVIKAVDKATAPLKLVNERIAKFTAPVRKLNNSLKALGAEAGVPRLMKSFEGVAASVGKVGAAVQTAAARMAGLGAGAVGLGYLFKTQFVDVADKFERLEMSLEAIEGGGEKAGKALGFIKDLTVRTPFQMEELANTFRLMRGAGMDPMNGSLQNVADMVAKVGGTGETMQGVATALSQAWGKTKLQGEEVNQLVERGIPAWGLLQRAYERVNKGRKTSIELIRKESEAGHLGQKAISLLIEQMGIESAGASEKMSKSWSGLVSNLEDQWTFFAKSVMDSGALDALKAQLTSVLAKIDEMGRNGELKKLAETFGRDLVNGIRAVAAAVPQVVKGVRDVVGVMQKAADLTGGWGNLLKIGLGAYIGGPLLMAVGSLTASIISMNLALAASGTTLAVVAAPLLAVLAPIAAVTAALVGLSAAAYQVHKNWDDIKLVVLGDQVRNHMGSKVKQGVYDPDLARLKPPTPGQASVAVDFSNVPAGVRVTPGANNTAPLLTNVGYSMWGS